MGTFRAQHKAHPAAQARKLRRLLVAAGLGLLTSTVALAYVIDGNRWRHAFATVHVGVPGAAPSGQRWQDALRAAMAEWSANTPFLFIADDSYGDPCIGYFRDEDGNGRGFPDGTGDARNGVDFRHDVCGNDFGSNVLAITLNHMVPSNLGFRHVVQSDIVFNARLQWDVYDGPPRAGTVDFYRTALHELGHVIGLGHEPAQAAIMAGRIGELSTLQPDDIAGVRKLYGLESDCSIQQLPLNAARHGALREGSCRVQDLFASSSDSSFVDAYRIRLKRQTTLSLQMSSDELDAVLLVTDLSLSPLEVFDDSNGGCNVDTSISLPAGDYLLLANTHQTPQKCKGNTGAYSLSITDSGLAPLGQARTTTAGTLTEALIVGGASGPDGASRSSFAATDIIDVRARLYPAPEHEGQAGRVHVLAVLADGSQYMQREDGEFVPFGGDLATLAARSRGVLRAGTEVGIASGLQARASGLAGQHIGVFVGYALDSAPGVIHYGNEPIRVGFGVE